MKIKALLLAFVATFLLSGCVHDAGRFTIVSTNNFNAERIDFENYKSVEGKSSYVGFLFFRFGDWRPTIYRATYDALQKSDTDVLMNAQSEYFYGGIPPIIWTEGFVIKGHACGSIQKK